MADKRLIRITPAPSSKITLVEGGGILVKLYTTPPSAGGGGNVFGPASATNNAIVRFDGVTGKLIQDSGITIADGASGTLSGTNSGDVTLTGEAYLTLSGQQITAAKINLASQVTGDLPYANLTPATAGSLLLGRGASGAGDWQEISLDSTLVMTGTTLSVSASAGGITQLTGDVTAGPGAGSQVATLATVNGSPGSFGAASKTLTSTVNAKGLVTAMAETNIVIAESQVTNLVTDLAGKQPLDGTLTALAGLTITQGILIYGTGADAFAVLAKDTNATRYLANTGASNAPAWAQVDLTNGVTGDLPFANFVQAGSAGFVGATGAGDYSHRTPTQVTAALDVMVGDSGAGGTKGLVPAPAAGDAAASKFLKADGTWAAPSGSGNVSTAITLTSGQLIVGAGTTAIGVGNLSGDVTTSGSTSTTIANSVVTLAKIANAAANSKLLGSGDAGAGSPYVELTLGTNLSMSGTTLNATGGGSSWVVKTSNYTAVNEDQILAINTSTVITIDLPSGPSTNDFVWVHNASNNQPVTIDGNGVNVRGASTYTLPTGSIASFVFDGSEWNLGDTDMSIRMWVSGLMPAGSITDGTIAISQAANDDSGLLATTGFVQDAIDLRGYVVGPGSATDGAFALYDGTTGKLIKNSSAPGANVMTFLATPSSANLAAAVTDKTGSGALTFATSPVFTNDITLPNGTSPTTGSVAKVAFDTDAWAASRGAIQVHDGTANTYVVAVLASDTPSNGQVPTWNTGGTITWETPSSGVPTQITVANEATDTTCFPAFFTAATGDLGPKTNTNLTYNSSTGAFSVGTSAPLTAGTIELGNSSDTTISRAASGQIAVEGNNVFTATKTTADAIQAAEYVTLTSSSTDAYAGTAGVTVTAYTTGRSYVFVANTANTGAASLNIDGLGAKTIVKVAGGVATALSDNDIRSGQVCIVTYDGTNFQLQSTLGNAASGGSGAVVAVKSVTLDTTFTTSSTSYTDLTGLSITYTPTSSSNNIWLTMSISGTTDTNTWGLFQFVRGSTAIGVGASPGSRTAATCGFYNHSGETSTVNGTSANFVDTPATTSSTTWKVQLIAEGGGTVYINRSKADTNAATHPRTVSTLTLIEYIP